MGLQANHHRQTKKKKAPVPTEKLPGQDKANAIHTSKSKTVL